jgi:hypothetical protein
MVFKCELDQATAEALMTEALVLRFPGMRVTGSSISYISRAVFELSDVPVGKDSTPQPVEE